VAKDPGIFGSLVPATRGSGGLVPTSIETRRTTPKRLKPGIKGPDIQRSPNWGRWTTEKATREGLEQSEWVYACIAAKARAISGVPWRVSMFVDGHSKRRFEWEKKGLPPSQRKDFMRDAHTPRRHTRTKGKAVFTEKRAHLTPHPNHPLEHLVENPNPFISRQEMLELWVYNLDLGGNVIWVKVRGVVGEQRNVPVALWPLMPDKVTVEPDSDTWIGNYVYKPTTRRRDDVDYPPQDVLHWKYPDPGNPYWGMSPLRAASRAVQTDRAQQDWQKISMDNRGIPDGIIALAEEIDDEQYEEATRRVREQWTGVEGARLPWVIGNAVKWFDLSRTPVEMDWGASRGMNRKSICAVLGVDESIIGMKENATLANMDAAARGFWMRTNIPLLDRIESGYALNLASEFGGEHVLWYDLSNVEDLAESVHERVRSAKILHTMGTPLEEINRRHDLGLDLEGVVGADIGWFSAGMVPAERAIEGNTDPNGPNTPDNPNTPAEGGEVVDEGDPQDINEPDPEDELSYVGNGHASHYAHDDRYRFSLEDAEREMDGLGEYIGKTENDYWFKLTADPEGHFGEAVTIVEESDGAYAAFYHGERNQERYELAIARAERW
jgi:HK97 family phage portal protein